MNADNGLFRCSQCGVPELRHHEEGCYQFIQDTGVPEISYFAVRRSELRKPRPDAEIRHGEDLDLLGISRADLPWKA